MFFLALVAVTSMASVADVADDSPAATLLAWLVPVLSVALTTVGLTLPISWARPTRPTLRSSLPGAAVIALGWHLLQRFGKYYVENIIAQATDVNATFALALGLLGLLYLASITVVLGLEVNVVLSRRLYPRALLTPFTDQVDLTEADRRAYNACAQAQRHKGFESISVSFDPPEPKLADKDR